MISSIIQALFKNKILPNMSEQEKKRQRIYDLLNAETKRQRIYDLLNAETKLSFSTVYKAKKKFTEKELFKEKRWWRIEQKTKRKLSYNSRYGD